ncbi:WYL domain-containing protein [Bittarella massiliensis (ex Durand et al. 2017)]|uniref:WYL domain-containing protein n=1 Tax=Bittarella massiliensis (ex Durand et al. 2017) TaxID=1720313 RepID=UPI0034A015CE
MVRGNSNGNGNELANAPAKGKRFIPAGRTGEIALWTDQLSIDSIPLAGQPKHPPLLKRPCRATGSSRLTAWTATGTAPDRRIAPACAQKWPLAPVAYCRKRGDLRLSRLPRAADLQVEEERFAPRDCPPPILDFSEALERVQARMAVRLHRSAVEWALDFCSCEDIGPDGDEHSIAAFPSVESARHYRTLLGFGDACECSGARYGRHLRGRSGVPLFCPQPGAPLPPRRPRGTLPARQQKIFPLLAAVCPG